VTLLGLLAAAALLVANALFVAAEFVAVSARRAQIEPLATRSRRAAASWPRSESCRCGWPGAQLGRHPVLARAGRRPRSAAPASASREPFARRTFLA
jgi:hypothetical protein